MSSSSEVTQALEDVERITKALFEATVKHSQGKIVGTWDGLVAGDRARWRAIVVELLHDDVVRVGRRPEKGEPPMTGQESMKLDTLGQMP